VAWKVLSTRVQGLRQEHNASSSCRHKTRQYAPAYSHPCEPYSHPHNHFETLTFAMVQSSETMFLAAMR